MTAPQRTDYGVIIVGGGILGLFTAYHLARAGTGPILVAERAFLSAGGSGRNAGGVRQQWERRETIRLARESVEAYRRFGREFGYNIWFRQGGYLFLADSPEELARLRSIHEVVRSEGLDARILAPEEVARHIPGVSTDGLSGGAYLRTDGTLYPFPAVWALFETVRSLGVEVASGLLVEGIDRRDGRVRGVQTSKGALTAPKVVNAAGAWSGELSRAAGLEVPNFATRHDILATEPLKPFLDPMVARVRDGLYFSQTMRGELVGGVSVPHPKGTAGGLPSSIDFLRAMSKALVGLIPSLRSLGILRAWSGFYDEVPDGFPLIGEDPRLPGFIHANGFGGHGFMLAPAASKRVAAAVLGEPVDLDPALFSPTRLRDGRTVAVGEGLNLG